MPKVVFDHSGHDVGVDLRLVVGLQVHVLLSVQEILEKRIRVLFVAGYSVDTFALEAMLFDVGQALVDDDWNARLKGDLLVLDRDGELVTFQRVNDGCGRFARDDVRRVLMVLGFEQRCGRLNKRQ